MRSDSNPNTGLSSTCASSYTASRIPGAQQAGVLGCGVAADAAAMLCAPNTVTNPAAYAGSSRARNVSVCGGFAGHREGGCPATDPADGSAVVSRIRSGVRVMIDSSHRSTGRTSGNPARLTTAPSARSASTSYG
jgi:hypothetical protein